MSDKVMQTPSAFYERGKSCLLSREPFESLRAYAKALQISLKKQDIELALNTINEFTNQEQLIGYYWIRKLLQIGLAVKFPATNGGASALEQLKKLASTNYQILEEPIVIVAGGCSVEVEAQMRTYHGLVLESFRDFKGTIVSGGTTSGISGLIGEAQRKYPITVRTVGYVPKTKTDLIDKRYREIRFTDGEKFSPLEPLQYWIDIIASGIKADGVKLLGINGGIISAIEYRMALALGAQVAIVVGSGMEADQLLLDNEWNNSKNLISMPNDAETLWVFIQAKAKDSHASEIEFE
jgi:hypothetical protein